ncbi:MAG: hypothetical protein KDH15_00155, partial [Rhodocyclaceae bacterium]|nr:hypothetical protein [Rhodocyclaceae bacterium]
RCRHHFDHLETCRSKALKVVRRQVWAALQAFSWRGLAGSSGRAPAAGPAGHWSSPAGVCAIRMDVMERTIPTRRVVSGWVRAEP